MTRIGIIIKKKGKASCKKQTNERIRNETNSTTGARKQQQQQSIVNQQHQQQQAKHTRTTTIKQFCCFASE